MFLTDGCKNATHSNCSAIAEIQDTNIFWCACPCHEPRAVARMREYLAQRAVIARLEGNPVATSAGTSEGPSNLPAPAAGSGPADPLDAQANYAF